MQQNSTSITTLIIKNLLALRKFIRLLYHFNSIFVFLKIHILGKKKEK